MPRPIANPGSRPHHPRSRVVEAAMEFQAHLDVLRRLTHPVYEAALLTKDAAVIAEAHALAATMRVARLQARRIAALADGLVVCADGLFEPGHGQAA